MTAETAFQISKCVLRIRVFVGHNHNLYLVPTAGGRDLEGYIYQWSLLGLVGLGMRTSSA